MSKVESAQKPGDSDLLQQLAKNKDENVNETFSYRAALTKSNSNATSSTIEQSSGISSPIPHESLDDNEDSPDEDGERCELEQSVSNSNYDDKEFGSSDSKENSNDSHLSDTETSSGSRDDEFPPEIHDINLLRTICAQVEHYLSDEYLSGDKYLLRQLRSKSEGFLSVKLLTSFKKVKKYTRNWRVTSAALKLSNKLVMSADGCRVRRLEELPENLRRCRTMTSVLCIRVPDQWVNLETISELFSPFGNITLARILKPGKSIPTDLRNYATQIPDMGRTSCAVVEFSNCDSAHQSCRILRDKNLHGMRIALLGPRIRRTLYKPEKKKGVNLNNTPFGAAAPMLPRSTPFMHQLNPSQANTNIDQNLLQQILQNPQWMSAAAAMLQQSQQASMLQQQRPNFMHNNMNNINYDHPFMNQNQGFSQGRDQYQGYEEHFQQQQQQQSVFSQGTFVPSQVQQGMAATYNNQQVPSIFGKNSVNSHDGSGSESGITSEKSKEMPFLPLGALQTVVDKIIQSDNDDLKNMSRKQTTDDEHWAIDSLRKMSMSSLNSQPRDEGSNSIFNRGNFNQVESSGMRDIWACPGSTTIKVTQQKAPAPPAPSRPNLASIW